MQAACGLAASLDDVAGEAAGSETTVIVLAPAELVDERPQRHRAVDAATGDDHVGAGGERARDRNRTQIGVGGKDFLRQLGAGVHFAHPGRAQFRHARQHVVALDDGDPEFHAGFRGQFAERRGAAGGIHAARVAHHLDALVADVADDAFHGHIDEIGGIARIRCFGARRRQNGHGELGQIVEHQVIDLPAAHQLRAGNRTVAPEAGGANDAHDLVRHVWSLGKCSSFSTQAASRLSRNAATPSAPSLRIWRANACAARSRMGPNSTSAHSCSSALVAAFAPGAQRAMPWRTVSSLASKAVASSATKSTKPMRSASVPSMRSPDSASRRAWAWPMRATTKGAIWAGTRPSVVSLSANFASLRASAMSAAQARPKPPPMAAPSTTATTTLGRRASAIMKSPKVRLCAAIGSVSPAAAVLCWL